MENINFSMRIKRLPYSRMLKSEMADYVEKTIDIVESHALESKIIAAGYLQLSAKEPDIKLLRLSYGIDTERLRVSKLKSELMLVISAFKIQVRLLSKSEPELDLHQIQNAINKHLRYLNKCKNDKQLHQKIAGFFDLLDANEELETALADFSLASKVDDIRSAFSQVVEATRKRVTLLSLRPIISTKEIVKGMKEAVDNLFKGIEVANMISTLSDSEEPEDKIDFVPLIDELNQLAEMYARSIAIRAANNKRKNKDKDDDDMDEDDEPIDEPETPEDGTTACRQTTDMHDDTDTNIDDGSGQCEGRISSFSTIGAPLSDDLHYEGEEDIDQE